ncbi:hypothetical protein [Thermoflexus sp.]|uniref:hypothetical protein n=1 Tax=Thermoflexus sp. TaxID=1969742 RepID=UPI0025D8D0C1|nr:hypothetical protein [Thermoflexus sp.]MDW8065756.1 hypothetical protein [Anaerolineae bacterium]MCS6963171.1 hypothetical protein [Thermoflexus sp.]MCS7350005.1 hypothetical protein [Thermoflexus sp.]MCX7691276.1 hypothetical protein [Thermoflexus sp.]MDW8179453.1 hypothetical protein [Anaerolineae bacterium]
MHPRTMQALGCILIGAGMFLVTAFLGFLAIQGVRGALTPGGFAIGAFLIFLVFSPLIGAGIYLGQRASVAAREAEEAEKQRRLLGMIQARGKVALSDLALELRASRDQVRAWIYDLVHLGLFSGYINWSEGLLYSAEAAALRDAGKCPNCGGALELAGKGVIRCPYCGTEIFLA